MAMMAMTTRSSISVKPFSRDGLVRNEDVLTCIRGFGCHDDRSSPGPVNPNSASGSEANGLLRSCERLVKKPGQKTLYFGDRMLESRPVAANNDIMTTKLTFNPAGTAPAVGPYSQAVRIGDFLFCSGQIPIDPATSNLVEGGVEAQADRVLRNIKAILDSQGLNFVNVVKSTVFLTDLKDFGAMNQVYAKYFTSDFPARSTVQVAALPKGSKVEIEVIAHF